MTDRKRNWPLWMGFLLSVAAFLSYPFWFVRYPVTRDVPWANFLLFGIAVVFLAGGLRRAFGQPNPLRTRVTGAILGLLSFGALGFFCFLIFYEGRQIPPALGAPRIGQKAPDFVLQDTHHQPVALTGLLSTRIAETQLPARGVLLIFYRGYW